MESETSTHDSRTPSIADMERDADRSVAELSLLTKEELLTFLREQLLLCALMRRQLTESVSCYRVVAIGSKDEFDKRRLKPA